jgi:hypothetical protein
VVLRAAAAVCVEMEATVAACADTGASSSVVTTASRRVATKAKRTIALSCPIVRRGV